MISDAIRNVVLSKKSLASSPTDIDLCFDKFAPMLSIISSPRKALTITRWLAAELKSVKGLEKAGHFEGNEQELSSGLHAMNNFYVQLNFSDFLHIFL